MDSPKAHVQADRLECPKCGQSDLHMVASQSVEWSNYEVEEGKIIFYRRFESEPSEPTLICYHCGTTCTTPLPVQYED